VAEFPQGKKGVMTFFNPFYQALVYIGFTDPVHPALAHMPIGLVGWGR
jgi:hypothetical protein